MHNLISNLAQKKLLLRQVLDEACPWRFTPVPSFPNLTSLVLEDCDLGYNLRTLWLFLRSTPAISRLALDRCGVWTSLPAQNRHIKNAKIRISSILHFLKCR
jgi:hypothetical protein